MKIFIISHVFLFLVFFTGLNSYSQNENQFQSKILYQTDDLIITQISPNAFEHTSFLQTQDFGKVPCNGLIVKSKTESVIFDTPSDDKTSGELIKWIKNNLQCTIIAVIPTHFHNDCLGGLKAFHDAGIPSYANFKTIELAKENKYEVPQNGFNDSLILKVGHEKIFIRFFGEGHTKDNVVGYFPSEKVIFGGCLIKELDAGKGYLGDANTSAWSNTVEKVKQTYPDVKIIIPGHGEYGGKELLDYTIKLFKNQ